MIYSEIFHVFFILAVFGIYLAKGDLKRCSFEARSGKDLGKMPIAYTFNTNKKAYIIYPDETGYFTIDSNQKIVISCSNNFFELVQLSAFQEIEVTCYNGTQFLHNRKIYEFSALICKDFLRSDSKKSSKKCKPNNNTVIDVGFKTKSLFFPLYCVCYDETNSNTLYTWYQVRVPFFGHFQKYERPTIFQDPIQTILNINAAYANHKAAINSILRLNTNTNTYLDVKDHFLTKGHFIPRTDVYYAREQAATCNYLNIFPQWNKCNATWGEVEKVIKVEMKKNPFSKHVVITGVYGTYTLPDARNRKQQLYLGAARPQLAVVKFVWKMVYDDDNQQNSVVYISYNNRKSNPEENVKHDINCPPITCPGGINNPYTRNWIENGIIYCCKIDSFQTKYIRFHKDVFSVEPNAVPAT